MKVNDRIHQILLFNDNVVFSFWELFTMVLDHFWIVRYFKVLRALTRLERKGLIVSKHLDGRKYYGIKK